MNALVKVSPYSKIPEWLHGEIIDFIELTKTLIHKVGESEGPEISIQYDRMIWDSIISTINRLHTHGIISTEEKNKFMQSFQSMAQGEDGINYPFYLLRILYYSGYLNPHKELFMSVRKVLIAFAKHTHVGEILQINSHAQGYFPSQKDSPNPDDSFDYSSHISQYTERVIDFIKSPSTLGEEKEEYIQGFSDFLFAESILDWKKCQNILNADTLLERIHTILLELLLGNFYENDKLLMGKVASLLIIYYDGTEIEKYILDYMAQYTNAIIKSIL